MPRRNSLYPRPIQPELIESGDRIEVEFPEDGGITTIKRAIVSYIQPHAGHRYILTQTGDTVAVYEPGKSTKLKFTLLGRQPIATPMLDMFTEAGRL